MLYIQIIVNNSFNFITDLASNEICYKFKVKDSTSLLFAEDLFAEIFNKLRLVLKKETNDVITFAFIIIKTRYDLKHLLLYFKTEDKAFLKLYYKYFILGFTNRKLSQQRVKPFKILKKIEHLVYHFQLSSIIKIYSIISIIQLKPFAITTAKILNSYKKIINIEPFFIHNENDFDINKTEINRIVKKKITREKTHYLLK